MVENKKVLGIVVTDKDGVIKSVSYSSHEDLDASVIGVKWYNAFSIPVEEVQMVEQVKSKVLRLRESGDKLTISHSYDKDGGVSGYHILVERICEETYSAQFLNKVSCLGKMVPGIAHEINNPLAYVSGWLQMFLVETNDADPKKKTYETLIREFERIASLANGLLDFTRQTPRAKKIFDVNKVIEDIITMIGYTMKNENVEIIKNLYPGIVAFGDSNRLKQVFINIMQNAREVMLDGGAMYISTSILQDNSVLIQLRDTGCGISKEQLSKIFCPTYTTKADRNGSGLGLSVCKTIIEEFGGTIDLDSKVGEGTTVSIVLAKYSDVQNKDYENVP